MNKSKLIKSIVGMSIIGIIIFLFAITSLAQIQKKGAGGETIPTPVPEEEAFVEPPPELPPIEECTGAASGLEPAPITIFDASYVISTEFKQASIANFCEVNLATNECGQIKEIIFGKAVIKYDPSATFSKDPSTPPESYPFGLFILDNEIYISFGVGASPLYSTLKTLGITGEYSEEEFYQIPTPAQAPAQELEGGARLLPGGLDRHRSVVYRKNTWNEIYLFTQYVTYLGELFLPEPGSGKVPSGGYDVSCVVPYKKYRLVEVKNTVSDFVINF